MDRDLADLARWWCWRRQRLDRTSRGVEDALRSVVGVSGANPWGALSLLARVPRLLRGAAAEGVVDTKRAVRVPAMRRGFWLVPVDWAAVAFHASRAPWRPARHRRRAGLSDEEYEAIGREVLIVTGQPRTVAEIATAIGRAKEEVAPAVATMAEEGSLMPLRARSIRSSDFTYVGTRTWLGSELRPMPALDALSRLAGEYLTAFGPVTPDDLAWWTGARRDAAAEALAAHDPVDLGGGYLLHRGDERAFTGMRPHLGRVNLLPKLDTYTNGYAAPSRARFAPPRIQELAYDASGSAGSMVLVEGRATGVWDVRFASDGTAAVRLRLGEQPGPRLRAAAEDEARLVGAFLEARETRVEIEALPKTPARSRPAAKGGR